MGASKRKHLREDLEDRAWVEAETAIEKALSNLRMKLRDDAMAGKEEYPWRERQE